MAEAAAASGANFPHQEAPSHPTSPEIVNNLRTMQKAGLHLLERQTHRPVFQHSFESADP
jgi:hypothetical protein